jgi:hypothetical protein
MPLQPHCNYSWINKHIKVFKQHLKKEMGTYQEMKHDIIQLIKFTHLPGFYIYLEKN